MGAVTPETCRVVLQWINICILFHLLDFYPHWIMMHGTMCLRKCSLHFDNVVKRIIHINKMWSNCFLRRLLRPAFCTYVRDYVLYINYVTVCHDRETNQQCPCSYQTIVMKEPKSKITSIPSKEQFHKQNRTVLSFQPVKHKSHNAMHSHVMQHIVTMTV